MGRYFDLAILMTLTCAGLLGCGRSEGGRLVVATLWNATERAAIDEAFHSVPPIGWIVLSSGDDAAKIATRLDVDVVLGLPERDCELLTEEGRLLPISPGDKRPWRIARTLNLGLAVRNGAKKPEESARNRVFQGLFAFDDPRLDRLTLAWAKTRMMTLGYGEVVRTAANAARVGRSAGALAAVSRGDAAIGVASGIEGAIDKTSHFELYKDSPRYHEGVAIMAGTPNEKRSREFVAFLGDLGQADPWEPSSPNSAEVGADSFLADLLGATLVDSLDDLRVAARAVEPSGLPPELNGYLDDPPPWPPTSVAKLRARDEPFPLLDTLAREISDDPEVRFWLLQSWDKPERPVDLAFLREMANAAKGRLKDENRLRVWLRGEWTAWARQHYRRIAREARRLGTS